MFYSQVNASEGTENLTFEGTKSRNSSSVDMIIKMKSNFKMPFFVLSLRICTEFLTHLASQLITHLKSITVWCGFNPVYLKTKLSLSHLQIYFFLFSCCCYSGKRHVELQRRTQWDKMSYLEIKTITFEIRK